MKALLEYQMRVKKWNWEALLPQNGSLNVQKTWAPLPQNFSLKKKTMLFFLFGLMMDYSTIWKNHWPQKPKLYQKHFIFEKYKNKRKTYGSRKYCNLLNTIHTDHDNISGRNKLQKPKTKYFFLQNPAMINTIG